MESNNKNARLVLNIEVDGFIFREDCIWENHLMGQHNGINEWCVTIPNPAGMPIELFCKEGDFVAIQTFVSGPDIVAKTAVVLPWDVATKYIYGYDELLEDNVSLESCFINDVDEEDEEPSLYTIQQIEEMELDELMRKSKTLTIEDLLEDDDF